MEYVRIQDVFPGMAGTAVTLGKFDGIHRGHIRLLEEVMGCREEGLTAVMFAIDVNDQMILSHEERAALLSKLGMEVLLEVRLNEKIRTMKAENFVREILVGDLGVCFLAVGEDYRFGYERKGTPELLLKMGRKYGFRVSVIPKEMDGKRKISSTFIREELRVGHMEKVSFLMGRDYFARGEIVHGKGLGHRFLLPTINLSPDPEKLLPPAGVYFTTTWIEGRSWHGITNLGHNPTVGSVSTRIETHLFDCAEDLYGQYCHIDFHHFWREEARFPSLEALRIQLKKDAEAGRAYFDRI